MHIIEELAGLMGVIRLKDEEHGYYLTASDDQESITLTKPDEDDWQLKNTEWRVEWLSRSNHIDNSNYVGQVRLWSIYNKMLCFHGDPADYDFDSVSEALSQTKGGPKVAQTAVEWRFELKIELEKIVAQILRWSHEEEGMMTLSVVDLEGSHGDSDPDPDPDPDSDAENDDSSTLDLSFISYYREDWLDHLNLNGPSWMVELVKKTKATEQQPVATHFKKSKENKLASQSGTTSNHSAAKHGDEENESSSPLGQVMTALTKWQVGQVYFSGHHAPNVGPSQSTFVNSGGNHNGSGVQTNGNAIVTDKSSTSTGGGRINGGSSVQKVGNAGVSNKSGPGSAVKKVGNANVSNKSGTGSAVKKVGNANVSNKSSKSVVKPKASAAPRRNNVVSNNSGRATGYKIVPLWQALGMRQPRYGGFGQYWW